MDILNRVEAVLLSCEEELAGHGCPIACKVSSRQPTLLSSPSYLVLALILIVILTLTLSLTLAGPPPVDFDSVIRAWHARA